MNLNLYTELLEEKVLAQREEIALLKAQIRGAVAIGAVTTRQGGTGVGALFGDDTAKELADLTLNGDFVPPKNLIST